MSRRALRSGAPRLLGSHRPPAGRWYDEQYRALLDRFGPFDSLSRQCAGIVAAAWVTYRQATERLTAAAAARQTGRGRRPSAAAIRALEKRQGLAQSSYDAALSRLESMVGRRASMTPLEALTLGARR